MSWIDYKVLVIEDDKDLFNVYTTILYRDCKDILVLRTPGYGIYILHTPGMCMV